MILLPFCRLSTRTAVALDADPAKGVFPCCGTVRGDTLNAGSCIRTLIWGRWGETVSVNDGRTMQAERCVGHGTEGVDVHPLGTDLLSHRLRDPVDELLEVEVLLHREVPANLLAVLLGGNQSVAIGLGIGVEEGNDAVVLVDEVLGQLTLFDLTEALGDEGWLKVLRLDNYAARRSQRPDTLQQVLFPHLNAL
jgi:hypothetical protein